MPCSDCLAVPVALALPVCGTAVAAAPDLIVVNADVHTVDPSNPRVGAFAVQDGRCTAVGVALVFGADYGTSPLDPLV